MIVFPLAAGTTMQFKYEINILHMLQFKATYAIC